MMEAGSLTETASAVTPYEIGTDVEIDAGRGKITSRNQAPTGAWWYEIEAAIEGGTIARFSRWHDETALHPVDAAVMALAADANTLGADGVAITAHDRLVGCTPILNCPEPSPRDLILGMAAQAGLSPGQATEAEIDAKFQSMLTGGAPSVAGWGKTEKIEAGFRDLLDKGSAIIGRLTSIKPFDLIVLRSGGPQMIVEKIEEGAIIAWWMDHSADLHVARFPRDLVELIPTTNHAEMRA
jgi:uncharacterized protein YodC (DUF2158 family)